MYVILDSAIMNSMALRLKAISLDYYLFFMCMYRTGYTASKLLRLTVGDYIAFSHDNKEYLGVDLIEEMDAHVKSKNICQPLFCRKDFPIVIPRRTVEYHIKNYGQEMLGTDKFGFKHIQRTFYYEVLRNNGYNYEPVRKLFAKRKAYMPDLDSFLNYCGMTIEEYEEDRSSHQKLDSRCYKANAHRIINVLASIIIKENSSLSEIKQYTELMEDIISLLEANGMKCTKIE